MYKKMITAFVIGVSITGAFAAGVRITTLTQTAQQGDSITAEWVNAVNTKLNTSFGNKTICRTIVHNPSVASSGETLMCAYDEVMRGLTYISWGSQGGNNGTAVDIVCCK